MYKVRAADVPADEVEPGVKLRLAIGDAQGARNFHLRVFTVAPGSHTPLHEHPWEHEVFILRGHGVVVAGEQETPFAPNDVVFVPPGELHQFRNSGNGDLEFICVIPTTDQCLGR
jgi:quercetin dioxygenase-like cupin family protein